MYAIASLLDTTSDRQTRELWQLLWGDCGLQGILETPTPHLTWHVADSYQPDAVQILGQLSQSVSPFRMRIAGLGIFSGEVPVLHLSVVKTQEIISLHKILIALISPLAVNGSLYYLPERWMPHITLAYRDTTPENMMCALERLAFRTLEAEVLIDNFALIFSSGAENGILKKFALSR